MNMVRTKRILKNLMFDKFSSIVITENRNDSFLHSIHCRTNATSRFSFGQFRSVIKLQTKENPSLPLKTKHGKIDRRLETSNFPYSGFVYNLCNKLPPR